MNEESMRMKLAYWTGIVKEVCIIRRREECICLRSG